MKKILVTMLALSLAVVSTVDAKMMRGGATSGAMEGAIAVKPNDVLDATKELAEAKKTKNVEGQEAAANDIVSMLTNPNMSEDEKKLMAKKAELIQLDKDIAIQEVLKADSGYGWFGFRSTAEQRENYNKYKNAANELKMKRKAVEKEKTNLEIALGKRYSKTIDTGLKGLAAVGISLVTYGVDKYGFQGKGMSAVSSYVPSREEMGKTYRNVKGRVFGKPAQEENLYGRTKRGLAEWAGTTAEKFPNE